MLLAETEWKRHENGLIFVVFHDLLPMRPPQMQPTVEEQRFLLDPGLKVPSRGSGLPRSTAYLGWHLPRLKVLAPFGKNHSAGDKDTGKCSGSLSDLAPKRAGCHGELPQQPRAGTRNAACPSKNKRYDFFPQASPKRIAIWFGIYSQRASLPSCLRSERFDELREISIEPKLRGRFAVTARADSGRKSCSSLVLSTKCWEWMIVEWDSFHGLKAMQA